MGELPELPPGAVPIAAGREADVFALDEHRVLRRYRRHIDVAKEARAMIHLAGLGYPVPAVYAYGGTDLVLERLTGPTLSEAIIAGQVGAAEGAGMLADLLRRLHALPTRPGAAPGSSIVHLDLHADNIVLAGRGPVVIDWCNAGHREADLDTALSALIVAQFAVDPAEPMAGPAGEFLDAFLAVAPGDPLRLLEGAVAYRAKQVGEAALLRPAVARINGGGA